MSTFIVMGNAGPIQNYVGPNVFLNQNLQTRPGIPLSQTVAAAPSIRRKTVCRYFRMGCCIKGPNCNFLHSLEATPNKSSLTQTAAPSMACPRNPLRNEEAVSQEKTCCICLENIRASSRRKKFGLLENCDHCYCHQCIMGWRRQCGYGAETRRQCPTCRAPFCLVTPSRHWPESAEKKRYLIEQFRKSLKSKPCAFFNNGRGVCTSGNNCFYSHALPVMKEDTQNKSQQGMPVPLLKDLPQGIGTIMGDRIPVDLLNPRRRGRRSRATPAQAIADLPPAMMAMMIDREPARASNTQPKGQGPSATQASLDEDLPPAMMSNKPPAKASNLQPVDQRPSSTPASVDEDLPSVMISNKSPAKASDSQPVDQRPSSASVDKDLPSVMISNKPLAKAFNSEPVDQRPSATPAYVDEDLPSVMISNKILAKASYSQPVDQRPSATPASVDEGLPPAMMSNKPPAKASNSQPVDQRPSSTPASVDEDLPPGMMAMMSDRPPARASNSQSGFQGITETPVSVFAHLPPGIRVKIGKNISVGLNPRRRHRRTFLVPVRLSFDDDDGGEKNI